MNFLNILPIVTIVSYLGIYFNVIKPMKLELERKTEVVTILKQELGIQQMETINSNTILFNECVNIVNDESELAKLEKEILKESKSWSGSELHLY